MNKKGFTLVELLAVIAILAILVVFAIPNVVKMFEKAKKENFLNEVKTLYNAAAKKYLSEAMNGSSATCYCSDGSTKLDINASSDLKYCVEVDDDGKVISMIVSNGKYMIDSGEADVKSLTSNSILDAPEGGIQSNMCIKHIVQNATGPVLSTLFNASDTTNFGVYTGEHNDTYGIEGNEPIIYFKTNKNNNVIFADHCWQMIRTTSSGGVRLLYNGKQVNNQCLTDRGDNNLGYDRELIASLNSSYYYADDYNFDGTNFSLVNPIEATWSDSTKDNLLGKYTCKGASATGTCTTLYLVSRYSSNTVAYAIPIKNNSHYSQFGVLQFNYPYNSPAYVGYKYGTVYATKTIAESNVTGGFAASVTYSNGIYTLTGTTSETVTNNTHYFCSSVENSNCKKVGYVYDKERTTLYYLELNGEANIDVALTNMLDSETNMYDSTIKIGLEAWYKKYIEGTNNDKFVEQDAVYCNKREIKSLGGFNPNGGRLDNSLQFKDDGVNSDLSCSDTKDRFSKNNGDATLKYPIGLMTNPEAYIIGNAAIKSGKDYWMGSANTFYSDVAYGNIELSSGGLIYSYIVTSNGVRGVVSIRAGVKVETVGDGTVGNPYVID